MTRYRIAYGHDVGVVRGYVHAHGYTVMYRWRWLAELRAAKVRGWHWVGIEALS